MDKIKAFIEYLEKTDEQRKLWSGFLKSNNQFYSNTDSYAISILKEINKVAEQMAKEANVIGVTACEHNRYKVQVSYDAFVELVEERYVTHEIHVNGNKVYEHYAAVCDGFTLIAAQETTQKKENASA